MNGLWRISSRTMDNACWRSPPVLATRGSLPQRASGPGVCCLPTCRRRVLTLLDDAGFKSTRVEGVDMTWKFSSAADYWRFLVDLTALGPLIRSLPEASREAFRAAVGERLAPFTSADGISLPSRCW